MFSDSGPKCLRASAEEDKTNGFFVAIFKKIKNKNNEPNASSSSDKKQRKRKRPVKSKTDQEPSKQEDPSTDNPAIKKKGYSESAKRRRKIVRKPVTA